MNRTWRLHGKTTRPADLVCYVTLTNLALLLVNETLRRLDAAASDVLPIMAL